MWVANCRASPDEATLTKQPLVTDLHYGIVVLFGIFMGFYSGLMGSNGIFKVTLAVLVQFVKEIL